MLITFESKHKVEIYSLIKQLLTLPFSWAFVSHTVHETDPTRASGRARASTEALDNRSCCTAASEPEKTSDCSHQSLTASWICHKEPSNWFQLGINIWSMGIISCCSHIPCLHPHSSWIKQTAPFCTGQADRLKKHQVQETQRHQRQHARPQGKVAQRHVFNSWLVR